ncbi:MAG: hypothetical protein AW07_03036 [Candidatus Accumulibacter sp. SK-11]|nr:MAG: hypothetical protein AW07_03036 [Candidatus Accumulibacter sp. SK-11]
MATIGPAGDDDHRRRRRVVDAWRADHDRRRVAVGRGIHRRWRGDRRQRRDDTAAEHGGGQQCGRGSLHRHFLAGRWPINAAGGERGRVFS